MGRRHSTTEEQRLVFGENFARDLETARRRMQLRVAKMVYGCASCGHNSDPRALEFHHLVPTDKDFEIGLNRRGSSTRLAAEIDKCRLLCANCHRTQEVPT